MDFTVLQFQDTPQRCGIAYSTENIIFLKLLTVSGDSHTDGTDIRQGTNPFENIGSMSDDILDILRSGPGNTRESAERSGIAEVAVRSKQPDIEIFGSTGYNIAAGCEGIQGQTKAAGKIIGTSARDITQGRPVLSQL